MHITAWIAALTAALSAYGAVAVTLSAQAGGAVVPSLQFRPVAALLLLPPSHHRFLALSRSGAVRLSKQRCRSLRAHEPPSVGPVLNDDDDLMPEAFPFEPRGFRSVSKRLGIRDASLDFTVIASDVPAAAAAMFTQSVFCGPAVVVGREHVADGQLQAFVINSKIANVATGDEGLANVREIVQLTGDELGIAAGDVLPSSTGIIGWQLPMDKMRDGIRGIHRELRPGRLHEAARAIMTTDTRPKTRAVQVGNAVLVGMAKGVGMVEPNMATVLSYFVTDAAIPADLLRRYLHEAVQQSFNMVSVDSDTSTSDTVAIMANGLAGDVDHDAFRRALTAMAIELVKAIASDGEGATKLVEVNVDGAASFVQAKTVAKSIVNSPLVKTAIFGGDPNWGRVFAAIGKCSQYAIDPTAIRIRFGDMVVYDGRPLPQENLPQLTAYLRQAEVVINVSLGVGDEKATVWGCDLSYEYVRINGEYST